MSAIFKPQAMKDIGHHAEHRRSGLRPLRRHGGFTLIEILAVVMLLGILLAATLPAFRSAHRKAMRDEAASVAMDLATASMEFRTAYGRWPCEGGVGASSSTVLVVGDKDDLDACGMSCDIGIAGVVKALSAADGTQRDNPRSVVFLELPSSRLAATGDADGPCPRDPWGRPFVMLFSRPVANQSGSGSTLSRIENGLSFAVNSSRASFMVESPDDAAAFSWGDPLAAGNPGDEADVVGSWGMR